MRFKVIMKKINLRKFFKFNDSPFKIKSYIGGDRTIYMQKFEPS